MRWALPLLLVFLVLGCAQAPQDKVWSSYDPQNATHREGLEGIFELLEKYPGGYERAVLECAPQYCRERRGLGIPARLELEEVAGEGAVRLLEIVVKGERDEARGYGSPSKEGLLKAVREYEGSEDYTLALDPAGEDLAFLEAFLAYASGDVGYLRTRLLNASLAMAAAERPYGIKRTAYAQLSNLNLYSALGDGRYRMRAVNYTRQLLALQGEDGAWRALPGEPRSSNDRLESAMGTWALSEAYLTGLREPGLADAVVKGGDHMLRDAVNLRRRITGFTVGYKPNALGFMAIALSEASLAAADAHRTTGDPRYLERAEAYRSMALELGDDLLRMQNPDGSWYDGPYHTEDYGDWRVISSWYQSMAWSGLAQASRVAEGGKREEYLQGVARGMRWVRAMEMPGGGYRGTLYPNGSMTEDDAGSTMVLQGFAIANSAGIDTRGEYLLLFLHARGNERWDGNMAFAYSEMLKGLSGKARPSPLRVVLSFDVETPRCITNLPEILAFLEERNARGTFYFTGAMAERYPGGVRSVLERRHEVGSHGYAHEFPVFNRGDAAILAGAHGRPMESVWDGSARTRDGYLEALGQARRALEGAGAKPRIYRSPVLAPSLTRDLAYLRALEEAGFTVDS
ncbi:MAG: polysaccharide deacetylase family protein, partial [Euryarchaeota archaeon]|nr:polysaccharide deacetylase family protein [Euryarchaeota archaeon]